MRSFSWTFAIVAAATAFSSVTFAADSFSSGNLLVTKSGDQLTLADKKGKLTSIAAGPVQLIVSSKGLWGDGYITIQGSSGSATFVVPRKSYVQDGKILAPASDTKQAYNISGEHSTVDLKVAPPQSLMQTCTYTGIQIGQTLICHGNTKVFPDGQMVINFCSGQELDQIQTTTKQDLYLLRFFDPANPQSEVARVEVRANPRDEDKNLGTIQSCR